MTGVKCGQHHKRKLVVREQRRLRLNSNVLKKQMGYF